MKSQMKLPKNSDVKRVQQMLSSVDKGASTIRGIGGILSHLFRCILRDKEVNGQSWGRYMFDYLMNPANGVPDNTRDRTSERGNINKELSRPEMTWKVFCKAMRFLKVRKMVLIVVIETEDGRQSTHTSSPVVLSRAGTKTPPLSTNVNPEVVEHARGTPVGEYHYYARQQGSRRAETKSDEAGQQKESKV